MRIIPFLCLLLFSDCGNAVFNSNFNNETIDQYFTALHSYWKFEESSGTRVDSINDNDLTDGNSVSQSTGIQNNAADFELSSSQYLQASAGQTMAPSEDFAFSLWIQPESTPSANAFLFRTLVSTNTSIAIFLTAATGITATIRQASSAYASVSSAATSFGTGLWHHIAFIGNGTTMKLYVNGSSVGSQSYTGIQAADGSLTVGAETSSTAFFDGLIDEFGYWNSDISFVNEDAMDALAEALYSEGRGAFFN